MPSHNFQPARGVLTSIEIDSESLRGNLLGDPSRRAVAVYLPEGYDRGEDSYPLLVYLAPYGGSGLKKVSWQQFGESIPQRIDRLVDERKMGPVVVALPDGFTSLGGNQYVNSQTMGRWEDFLLCELVPFLEKRLRLRQGPRHRAVIGYSSGGYGALLQGLRHGNSWAAVACHSGDMGFENLFRGDFPKVVTTLARYNNSAEEFLAHFREQSKLKNGDLQTLMILAMAASYDPAPEAPQGIRLPVDLDTCELDPERWARWLAHDPVEMIRKTECQASLRQLRGLYLDCGNRDQYHLHFGARVFVKSLQQAGIPHRYEEFNDDHSAVEYRLDISLPFLYEIIG